MTHGQQAIVFDVDGVLANFTLGFSRLAAKTFPDVTPMHVADQPTWDGIAEMTPAQIEETWRQVGRDASFWYSLPKLISSTEAGRILRLVEHHHVYFVTNRMGNKPKVQTENWLRNIIGIDNPTVIISKWKADVCKGVDARFAIDDKADNACAIAWFSPRTISFLRDRKYNQFDPRIFGSSKVNRVCSVSEFLDKVEAVC